MIISRSIARLVLVALAISIIGCGPRIYKQYRWDIKPYDEGERAQEKDGIAIKIHDMSGTKWPPELRTSVQACRNLVPLVDSTQAPVMEQVDLIDVSYNQKPYKLTITNNTDHVIRFSRVVIRFFDAAGNQHEPLTKDDLSSALLAARPCQTTNQILPRVQLVKLIDRNTEILPGTSLKGYVVIGVSRDAQLITGTRKLALYEIPVETDPAGAVTKTTRFEFREVVKKYEETIEKKFGEPPRTLSNKEVDG